MPNRRKWIVAIFTCMCLSALAHAASPSCTLSLSTTSGNAPLTVNASGACTDADNDIAQVTLDWGDGSAPLVSNQTAVSGMHTYAAAGQFRVTLTASDSQNNSGSDHQDVTVTSPPPPNSAPTCQLNVAPASGSAPLTVVANANCQDPDNNIVSVTIAWGDGSPPATGTAPNLAAPHTYSQTGTFTVTATATDAGGLSGSATQNVTVNAAPPRNQPPNCTFNVAPNNGQAPLVVSANGSCSDPEGGPVTTSINWGDGAITPGSSGTHTFTATGNFNVVLTGIDNQGASGSDSQHVHVGGPPPNTSPTCSLTATPAGGEAPVTVTASTSCSDPDNDIAGIIISFGDGFYQAGPSVTHTFANGGAFAVSVTATDRAGNTSKPDSQNVNITDPPKLFVGVSNGEIREFSRTGALLGTVNTNQGGSITGMDIDALNSLYVTNFTANSVSKFSGTGALLGSFGSGYNCKPESIVFDQGGNAYVGQTGCSKSVLKFDAYGNLFGSFTVQTEAQGSDWVDIADDQCTILYTSEGGSVLRFNACTGQQLGAFATGLQRGLAIRVLPDGGAVVANNTNIIRFDLAGRQVQTYDAGGHDCWATLTLDRNPTTFWAADFCTSDIVRFGLDSGAELAHFSSGTAANTVFGVAMKSAPPQTSAGGPLIASPNSANIASGQSATFALNFDPNSAAKGENFSFACANLPVGANCAFSPPSFTAGSSNVSATLTIVTAVRTGSLLPLQQQLFYAALLPMAALLFCGFGAPKPRKRSRKLKVLLVLCALLVAGALLSSISGCGGGANSNNAAVAPLAGGATPAGNYTVMVSVRSGSLSSSTAVNLAVH